MNHNISTWRQLLATLMAAIAWMLTPVAQAQTQTQELLIYCGITMVRPITELARQFEAREGVRILVSQGGSEDLYQSAQKSRRGDLYLPGEPSYRDKHIAEGLLGDFKLVGYNQMALLVKKGNPKRVRPALRELLRKDLVATIGSSNSGSVGQEGKRMLDREKLYPEVIAKAAFLMPDSRALNLSLKRGEADVALNWRATAFFPDNEPYIDAVDLDPQVAQPQALLLMQLTFSQHPALARKFIDFVASPAGQAVFRKHGFLDAQRKSQG